jgi:ABC-type sugar transport system, periplasmic component
MKRILALILSVVLILCLSACGNGDSSGSDDAPFTIGFVMIEPVGNSYNQLQVIKRECEARGWELMYDSSDNDSEKCLSLTNNFITKGADALYVYTVDMGTQTTVKEICDRAGVHVVFTGLMDDSVVQIADDEAKQGQSGAEVLTAAAAEKWGDLKADLIIATEATEVGDGNRIRMHENYLPGLCASQNYPEENVVWLDIGLDLLKATSLVANTLSAHPEAKRILVAAFHDQACGQGPLNALKAAGRDGDALILSYHISDRVTAEAIKNEPAFYGSFYFPPESYVTPLFECFDIWAAGGTVEVGLQTCQYVLVTKDNIDEIEFEFD